LPVVVIYENETSYLTPEEEHRLKIFEEKLEW
jgi:hypothetical protein